MEIVNLVPPLTGSIGQGVRITRSHGSNAWKAFDRIKSSNNATYTWNLEGSGWRSMTLEFDSTVTITKFTIAVGYMGLTSLSKQNIIVDGVSENFSRSISYTKETTTYEFELTKPLRGKTVVLDFYSGNSDSYIQEIELMGFPSKAIIGIDGKLFSIINGKLTLISETDDYTLDLENSSTPLYNIATNMSSIQSVTDKFSLQTIIKE